MPKISTFFVCGTFLNVFMGDGERDIVIVSQSVVCLKFGVSLQIIFVHFVDLCIEYFV